MKKEEYKDWVDRLLELERKHPAAPNVVALIVFAVLLALALLIMRSV